MLAWVLLHIAKTNFTDIFHSSYHITIKLALLDKAVAVPESKSELPGSKIIGASVSSEKTLVLPKPYKRVPFEEAVGTVVRFAILVFKLASLILLGVWVVPAPVTVGLP